MTYSLLITAFVISTCGLVYELIAGTVASYLLGDSVTQFSTVIGVYLFSMGIGSFLSRYVDKDIILKFIQVEMLVGLVGGCSAALLFMSFEHVENFRILLYALVTAIGVLVGLEIPLLMRILQDKLEFKELVSQVFTFDYVGALLASLLFPLLLVPYLGLIRSSFLFGIFNALVAVWTVHLFRNDVKGTFGLRSAAITVAIALSAGFVFSDQLMTWAESSTYQEPIIFSKSTPYQRIVITCKGKEVRLFLNGNLQFNSRDEYRYHEALVHPAMSSLKNPENILVLGGGDGMAVRELLKYPSVKTIQLVDLDPEMTKLFRAKGLLSQLNNDALSDPRVTVINQDAFVWLRKSKDKFDCAIIDFPDPSNFSLGKLYSDTFYKTVKRALKPGGVCVIQSTSPYFAKNSYWCVVNTLESVGFHTTPYHAYVPSFGDWGYVVASIDKFEHPAAYPANLRYVTDESFRQMLNFPPDMVATEKCVNKLNNQKLVHLFESEWGEYVETF
ncbi:polyamine aminopropyltransferase [Candidatus Obscuribacterales bacterium]|nr:polyamine aminopropyltransferase [Candidatus Obscuribacterales bacterium]MBX3149752.1 polyamine aminopropyltransferase [Candidatus Obscuribacterales bacterium]